MRSEPRDEETFWATFTPNDISPGQRRLRWRARLRHRVALAVRRAYWRLRG